MLKKHNRIPLMELVRARQVNKVSRREFLYRATAMVGSATVASSLLAACQATDTAEAPAPVVTDSAAPPTPVATVNGFTSGSVTYPDADGTELSGYVAYEAGQDPRPIVIVLQEWWGLNDHIKEVTERIAREGYVALAPDLYHGEVTTEPDEARKLVMALSQEEAVVEIQQAIAYLKGEGYTTDKTAVIGFCMGGGLVAATAANTPDLNAGVIFYGQPLAIDEARQVKAAMMTHLGTEDRISQVNVEMMHAIFEESGIPNEFHIYEGAQHAFFNDTRESSYDEEAAKLAWERTLAWLEAHLS
ncbi:MAG TPA: dienelactone hydrolase family protein [Anaerolineae bacterium]|nr:dienelactone hydrolase family protein [Anaerolineae bacterium]